MSIELLGRIHSLDFFDEFLNSVSDYYKNWDKRTPPIIDLDNVEYIDPPVLPLLASLGLYLKNFHSKKGNNEKLTLKFGNTPKTLRMIHFLDHSNFLRLVGKGESLDPYFTPLDIFNYNPKAVGGYSGYDIKEIRHDHFIQVYFPNVQGIINYHDLSLSKQNEFRDELMEWFIIGRVRQDFENIVEADKGFSKIKIVDDMIGILSEIIVNGIVHSKSEVFALVNCNRFRSILSVSDIGIGFEASLNKKREDEFILGRFYILNHFLNQKSSIKEFYICYIIFDALLFSLIRDRKGLIDIVLGVSLVNGGFVRIHSGDVQLVFSIRFKDILETILQIRNGILEEYAKKNINKVCLNKLFSEGAASLIKLCEAVIVCYYPDKNISALRRFDTKFPGVHLECEIKN